MRRLPQWAFNGLAVVSLLACVGACVLWVRSYWRWDGFDWVGDVGQTIGIESRQGAFYVMWGHDPHPFCRDHWFFSTGADTQPWEQMHGVNPSRFIAINVFDSPFYRGGGVVRVSYWFVVTALVTMPGWWFMFYRRRRVANRLKQCELCSHCGYDLTDNVSGICPECGKPVPAPGVQTRT